MTVVLPLPLGPRKPKISPFSTRKLTPSTATKSPKRRTRFLAKMEAASGRCPLLAGINLTRSFQLHVRRHAAAHAAGGVIDANFYADYLVHPFAASLHVARKKFGLLINLLHDSVENGIGERVDADLRLLADAHAANFRFGDVNADVHLIALKKCGDRRIGRYEISRADVQYFHGCVGGRNNLRFARACGVVVVSSFREVDIFSAAATLEFLLGCQCRAIARFSGSDFFRTVALLQLRQFLLRI